MGQSMLQNVNSFCVRNACIMEKWIERFTTAQQVRQEQRRAYRRAQRGHVQLAPELENLSDKYMIDWLHEEMERFKSDNGEGSVSNEEWEYARGCEPKVHKLHL